MSTPTKERAEQLPWQTLPRLAAHRTHQQRENTGQRRIPIDHQDKRYPRPATGSGVVAPEAPHREL